MATPWRQCAVIVCLILFVSVAPARASSPTTATPFQHVIIVVQENHSFDNYFGTYPTANGTLVTPITSQLPSVNGIPNGVCLPYGATCIKPHWTNSTSPTNPVEGQLTYEADYQKNGTGFPNNSGTQSMVYFDYHTIPAYWDYAEEYGLADNYFAAFLTQSNANRLALISGNSSTPDDSGPPPYLPYDETIFHQLDSAGVSWGYFDYFPSISNPTNLHFLDYISGMNQQEMAGIQNTSSLFKDLSSGTGLPAVSYVDSLGNKSYDEHPSADPTQGEQWVVSLVNAVESSSYWKNTVIFITYDEGGGFYDNVIPLQEFILDNGFANPVQALGQRVPLIAISPYSKEAYVSNTLMSHFSLVHFIDYNWNLSPLTAEVGNANLPLGFFNFSQQQRAPLVLGKSGPDSMNTYPIPLQIPLDQSSTATSDSTTQNSGGGSFSLTDVIAYVAIVLVIVVATVSLLIARRSRRDVRGPTGHSSRSLNQVELRP